MLFYLSQFLKDKQYYPKTYIYNKSNRYIPDDNSTWFIKKCAFGSYGGKDIFVANNYNGISDKHIGYFNELKLLKKLQFQESKKRMRVFYIMRAIIK